MLFAHLRNIGPITHFVPTPKRGCMIAGSDPTSPRSDSPAGGTKGARLLPHCGSTAPTMVDWQANRWGG